MPKNAACLEAKQTTIRTEISIRDTQITAQQQPERDEPDTRIMH